MIHIYSVQSKEVYKQNRINLMRLYTILVLNDWLLHNIIV